MNVLITGGTGFIGSHQAVALIEAGHTVTIVDDGSNSHSHTVIDRIAEITGIRPAFFCSDVRNTDLLAAIMRSEGITAVMHLAAKKSVAESIAKPIVYTRVNVDGLASVVEAADRCGIHRLVFSSTGSVYGNADQLPIPEYAPHRPTNPYSETKSFGEGMLRALCETQPDWRVVALRYFNPAGAHPSGLIGEDSSQEISNLLPALMSVAAGRSKCVEVFGDDYPTCDGTGVRDYVHVLDVAHAHTLALDLLTEPGGFEAINIGRGVGVSVGELVSCAREASGSAIPVRIRPRRAGDVAALYGATTLAQERLGLTEYRSVLDICRDAWRWSVQNPDGYLPAQQSLPVI